MLGNDNAGTEPSLKAMGFIDSEQLRGLAKPLAKSGYGTYLLDLLEDEATDRPEWR